MTSVEHGSPPEDWVVVRLSDVARIEAGGSAPQAADSFVVGGTPFVRVQHFDGDTRYVERWDEITDEAKKSYGLKLFPAESILFPKSGASIRLEKRAKLRQDSCVVGHLAVAAPRTERCDSDFLYFRLKAMPFADLAGGSTLPFLSLTAVGNVEMLLPPLAEQRAIAACLSKLQSGIECATERVSAVADLKSATMVRLFREGLRREQTKETELGEIPDSWGVRPLTEVCRILSGGTPARDKPQYWNGGIPWVRTGEINYRTITKTGETITNAGLRASAARIFPAGTLLMAMYGQGVTRGKVARLGISAATNQACAAFFPDETRLSSEFLYAYFSYSYHRLREAGHGANQKNLSADLLRGLLVPIPDDVSEQRAIFEVLDGFDRALEAAEGRRRALNELFTSTLHLMMTGELRVGPLADLCEKPHE